MNEKNNKNKEGDEMLAIKRNDEIKNETNCSHSQAKNEDVIKAIMKSNKKHSKMMERLSK